MNSGGTEHHMTRPQQIIAYIVVPLLVAAIAAAALIYANRDKDDNGGDTGPIVTTTASGGPASTTSRTALPPTTTTSTTPRPPAQTYLDTLKPIEGDGPRSGSADVNGETYPHALYASIGGCRKSGEYTYNIGRDYTTFDTTLGLRDDTESASVVQFEIFADGAPVYTSGNMTVGQSTPVSIPVDNVLQLKIGFVYIDGEMGICSDDGYAVWGDATLR
jgi:hypothetical protein